jgi:SPP1 family phage portal protein
MNERKLRNYVKLRLTNIDSITIGKKYYNNFTDIKNRGVVPKNEKNIMRNADNRISHNFHQLLVDEKVAYMFTYPIMIDVDDNEVINDKLTEVLGDKFVRKMKDLGVEASNTGCSWLHYWANEKNEFKYEKVESEQILPFYSDELERELVEVLRAYKTVEYDDNLAAVEFIVVEDWTKDTFDQYKFRYTIDGQDESQLKGIRHNFGRVPFIPFANNSDETSDLIKYKDLVDLYDRVVSGYANDIEDIQEILWIITNYDGNSSDFLNSVKKYKTIILEDDGDGGKGGVETLSVDIPVEARNSLLELLKKQIYESGQGLQQDNENFGNASGVALKFFYRKLELKAGLLETEFRESINKLVEAILDFYHLPHKKISQVWSRNMIASDLETSQIATQSVGIIPEKLILQNHPWVDDVDEAERLLEEEEKSKMDMFNSYPDMNQRGKEVDINEE